VFILQKTFKGTHGELIRGVDDERMGDQQQGGLGCGVVCVWFGLGGSGVGGGGGGGGGWVVGGGVGFWGGLLCVLKSIQAGTYELGRTKRKVRNCQLTMKFQQCEGNKA